MTQVLVVEDDALIGLLLAEMLREMNFEVCAVETTQSGAVAAALRLRPDLIIVDAKLGVGSGIVAMSEIESHGPVPHIFMSGERLAKELYGAPTLMKPFSEQTLAGAIREAWGVPVKD